MVERKRNGYERAEPPREYAKFKKEYRCKFCRDKVERIDYKDIISLLKLMSGQAKILPRRQTGTCRKHQKQAKIAIKRAKYMALLPYVSEHVV
jgi:small subunit ribosomal protein S18